MVLGCVVALVVLLVLEGQGVGAAEMPVRQVEKGPAALGDVFCVALEGGGSYPGCTQVFTNVQAAVDAAAGEEVIKVAGGVYTGVQSRPAPPEMGGSSVVSRVVCVTKTVTIRGGYTVTNWTESDPERHPTTLDAEGQGRVLLIAGDIRPVIEELRLTGGKAVGHSGGGVYLTGGGAMLRENVIVSNTADLLGGGMAVYDSNAPWIASNVLEMNTAGSCGGMSCGTCSNCST